MSESPIALGAVLTPQELGCLGLLPGGGAPGKGGGREGGPYLFPVYAASLPFSQLAPPSQGAVRSAPRPAASAPREGACSCQAASQSCSRAVLGCCTPKAIILSLPGCPCGLERRAGTLLPTAQLRPPGPWPAPTWRSPLPSEPLQGGWTQRGGCFCDSSSRRFAASCNSAWRAGAAAAARDALQSGPSARP